VILTPATAFTVPIALACELADACAPLSVCRQFAPASPTRLNPLIPMQTTSAKSEFLLECILGHSTFLLGQMDCRPYYIPSAAWRSARAE
jgi:hypothetical protein